MEQHCSPARAAAPSPLIFGLAPRLPPAVRPSASPLVILLTHQPTIRAKQDGACFSRSVLATPCSHLSLQSLIQSPDFQHILRLLNTNVDGTRKIMFALTVIPGIGRRFANIICKKADIDLKKR
jgi:hypothetical protein